MKSTFGKNLKHRYAICWKERLVSDLCIVGYNQTLFLYLNAFFSSPFDSLFCNISSYNLSFIHAVDKQPSAIHTALSELPFEACP